MLNKLFNKTINNGVNLYIDDSSLRLLISQGKRIKQWTDMPLEPGLINGSVVEKEDEVASRLKKLFEDQKVSTRKVCLGLSGMHSLTRPIVLPQLPKAMLAEAVVREARRVLPVPLDQIYLSWRVIPGSPGKIQVFLAAIPRKTADSLVKTLRSAGLEPLHMIIKPLALTRALPVSTAILVDVQPKEFDIVVITDGIPQPVRTINLPNEEQTWEKKLNMIASDADRTIKFYDTNNPDRPLAANLPIYVSGELIGKPELQKILADATGRSIEPLSSALKEPEGIDPARCIINLAMATSSASAKDASFSIANINVLPAPYQPKPISLTKVIGIPSGAVVAGLAVPMIMMMQTTASDISALQTELDHTNQVVNQKTTEKKQLEKDIADLQIKVVSAKDNCESLQFSLDSLTVEQKIVSGDLAVVLEKKPLNAILGNVNESGDTLTISGQSPQESDVLAYASNLEASGRFVLTTVSSLKVYPPEEGENVGYVEFVLTLLR